MATLKDRKFDKFGGYYLTCGGNRKLINEVKKLGLATFNPVGEWNGYGYDKEPMAAKIENISDLKKFNNCLKIVEGKKTAKKTEQEKIDSWVKRLEKLTSCGIETAAKIAEAKIEYKLQQIEKLECLQNTCYSPKRAVLIRKIQRENPLRYISDKKHGENILGAHRRHIETDYECKLNKLHELEEWGLIDKGSAKEKARTLSLEEIEKLPFK